MGSFKKKIQAYSVAPCTCSTLGLRIFFCQKKRRSTK